MIRIALLSALLVSGCQWNNSTEEENGTAESGTSPRKTASDGEAAEAKLPDKPMAEAFVRPGFAVYEQDGRLWIFEPGSEAHVEFLTKGEPAKRITLIGAGPDRKTIMGAERDTLESYRDALRFGLPGFVVFGDSGRLWVFREGGEPLAEFLASGEPAKRVTLVGAGPGGKTLMGAERDTVADYRDSWKYARDGYVVIAQDGRLWVFRAGGEALAEFMAQGEPAKRVTLIGAGPDRRTIMGAERETLDAYVVLTRYGLEGFAVVPDDGRLWVFRQGTKDYEDFLEKGEPAKRVTLIGAGPDRRTVLGSDRETLDDYIAATRYGAPGFRVFNEDGRLWVFREGSDSLEEYLTKGEPAKRVTLVGAGPDRKTLLGAERETLDAYIAARRSSP